MRVRSSSKVIGLTSLVCIYGAVLFTKILDSRARTAECEGLLMDTPFQGAAWSVLHEHLPYYAALLFSVPPVSFVLIKVGLAARSSSKQKVTKQWHVTRDQDQGLKTLSSVSDAGTRNSSHERLNRAVENILRSAEMTRTEEAIVIPEPTVVQGEAACASETEAASEARLEFVETDSTDKLAEMNAMVEAFESEAMAEIVEPEEADLPAIPSIPARPCRQRRPSSQTSRLRARGRRRADSSRHR